MAIAIALPGFNDLGPTPIFLLTDHFLYRFSMFRQKMKKIYRLGVPFSSVSVQRFQIPFEGLRFVKTLATFGIIYATDPLLQNMIKIVYLR